MAWDAFWEHYYTARAYLRDQITEEEYRQRMREIDLLEALELTREEESK